MANHKRRHPKAKRAGCLLCKPHKHNALKNLEGQQKLQEREARLKEKEQKNEVA